MKKIPTFISLDKTAVILDISRSTAKRLAQQGKLPATKISKKIWRVNQDELLERMKNGNL